jgi:hypothetical protein
MLRYPADEPLASRLVRLDTALANAQKTGLPMSSIATAPGKLADTDLQPLQQAYWADAYKASYLLAGR